MKSFMKNMGLHVFLLTIFLWLLIAKSYWIVVYCFTYAFSLTDHNGEHAEIITNLLILVISLMLSSLIIIIERSCNEKG